MNQKLTIPIGNLTYQWSTKGKVRRTFKSNIDLMQAIYVKFAQKYNGMLFRDKKWWEQRVLTDGEAQIAIAYNDNDTAEGYIIYTVKDEIVNVREIVYHSLNGRKIGRAHV